MNLDDDAQQFFSAHLQGVAAEGPNVILSFATPIPSPDQSTRRYAVNVRVVMSSAAVTQMVEFLTETAAKAQRTGANVHPMPETKQ